ncbi:unnamed protein product [Phytomonas sp. Hart1]|nr:unnamed protein product [Phytomonas sp. Hart1]|eukprot:CCW70682.1 unnamed protein product [Phytomonas sp. isolate Hart1]
MTSSGDIAPGINMPKKRDPRLRGIQAPQTKQFFDSADYEVRRQQNVSAPQLQPQAQTRPTSYS